MVGLDNGWSRFLNVFLSCGTLNVSLCSSMAGRYKRENVCRHNVAWRRSVFSIVNLLSIEEDI